jgi:hypothetical protein
MDDYYSPSVRQPATAPAFGTPPPPQSKPGTGADLGKGIGFVIGLVAGIIGVRIATGGSLSAYSIGQAVGLAVMSVLVATLIRWIYLKAAGKDAPLVTTVTLVVALAIGIPTALIARGADAQPPSEAEVSAAFTPLSGYTYQVVPPAQLQSVRDAIASQPDFDEAIAVFDARQILVGSQPVAAMVIMGVDPDEFTSTYRDDFLAGFRDASGQDATSVQLGGEEAYAGQSPAGPFITFFDEDDGMIFMVIGISEGSIKEIAKQVHAGNVSTI